MAGFSLYLAPTAVADEAVLTLIPAPPGFDGTFISKEEIGAWYDGLAATNGRGELSNIVVTGNTVTYNLAFYSGTFEGLGISPAKYDGAAVEMTRK